jgi:hypothetical protein
MTLLKLTLTIALLLTATALAAPKKPVTPQYFANCTAMRKVYPNGVPRSHPSYQLKHDRDNDGWACEPTKRRK